MKKTAIPQIAIRQWVSGEQVQLMSYGCEALCEVVGNAIMPQVIPSPGMGLGMRRLVGTTLALAI